MAPCGPHCQPATTARAWPVLRFGVLAGLVLAAVIGTPVVPRRARGWWQRHFSRAMLRAVGVRLAVSDVTGRPVDGAGYRAVGSGSWAGAAAGSGGGADRKPGVLVVANHLSWIDVLAVAAVAPVRLLAKREVRTWPLLGGLAVRTGALFVDRSGLRDLPATVEETAAALRGGADVVVFPEGSTWCGAAAGPFSRAAFQAAIDAGVPVQPVAITLRRRDGGPAPEATYVGDQTLVDSIVRVLRSPGLVCELTLLPQIAPDADRRELARRAGAAIGAITAVPHEDRQRPRTASAAA